MSISNLDVSKYRSVDAAYFRASKAGPQAISISSDSQIDVFDTVEGSLSDQWDGSQFVAPISGTYRFSAQCECTVGAPGAGFTVLRVNCGAANNTTYNAQYGGYQSPSLSFTRHLDAGDPCQMFVFQSVVDPLDFTSFEFVGELVAQD